MIANYAIYDFDWGGDLSFTGTKGHGRNTILHAKGDAEGKPRNQTGWRASCMYLWNTTEGGPCFLRPTGSKSADSPSPKTSSNRCLKEIDSDWKAVVDTKR